MRERDKWRDRGGGNKQRERERKMEGERGKTEGGAFQQLLLTLISIKVLS